MKKHHDTSSAKNTPKPIKKSRAALVISFMSVVITVLTVVFMYVMWDYIKEPQLLRDEIGDHYVIGAVFMVLISAVQVIVALIPGEFVEVAAGFIFGSIAGSLLCLGGIVLGSCVTILLVRRFGRRFVYVFYPKEKLDNLPFLNTPRKRNILTFIIFAIPGTPKDLFTYAIGLTDMKITTYIALTTLARFPSVILSTLSGDAMGTKEYWEAVIFFVITAVVSGAGLLVYRLIEKKHRKKADDGDEA